MTVSARMSCDQIVVTQYGRQVNLVAVYSDDKSSPNYSYSKATPSGNINLMITNPGAFEQFEAGKTYDIVFTEYTQPTA